MDNNHLHFRAEFTIDERKIEDFKKLIQQMARTVQELSLIHISEPTRP